MDPMGKDPYEPTSITEINAVVFLWLSCKCFFWHGFGSHLHHLKSDEGKDLVGGGECEARICIFFIEVNLDHNFTNPQKKKKQHNQ